VELVLARALEKDPGRRYQSMDEMANDLRLADQGEAVKLSQSMSLRETPQPKTRARLITLSLCTLLFLFLGTSWFLFTDDGVCLQQRMSLSSKPSQKKILHWLQVMDGMETKGNNSAAKRIRQGLRQICNPGTAILL